MCGVFATTRPDLWRPHVASLKAAMQHRGPDGHGVWTSQDDSVMLAHSRLSIIGLGREGDQPCVGADGQALSYNGEIYNYRDLAEGLEPLAKKSDTRTILGLIERDGFAALNRLRGMYAFAHWNPATRQLAAVRDPWGIKPLYVLDHPTGGVTVSSEIGPLLLTSEARVVDPIGLAGYLAFGHSGPLQTAYLNIRKLAPGVVAVWTVGPGRSVQLSTGRLHQERPTEAMSLAEALNDSVKAHLVADVVVGVFLSGGVDSTLISALAREHVSGLRSFTIAFPELREIDESDLAASNARALGIRHEVVPVRAADMVAALDLFLKGSGEPFGDAASLPVTVLSRHVGQQMKVVLTGEGADEMLGGYGRYRISRWLPRRPLPGVARVGERLADQVNQRRGDRPRDRALEAVLRSGGARSHASLAGSELQALERHTTVGAELDRSLRTDWAMLTSGARGREAARRFDLRRWLPNTYLEKTDRATMAGGLEARTPFLDPVVATSAEADGREFGKEELVAELHRRCPDVRLPDRKKGLAVPISLLMREGMQTDLDHSTRSTSSLLVQLYGDRCAGDLAARAKLSPTMAYRLAVLGRWEAHNDVSV